MCQDDQVAANVSSEVEISLNAVRYHVLLFTFHDSFLRCICQWPFLHHAGSQGDIAD